MNFHGGRGTRRIYAEETAFLPVAKELRRPDIVPKPQHLTHY